MGSRCKKTLICVEFEDKIYKDSLVKISNPHYTTVKKYSIYVMHVIECMLFTLFGIYLMAPFEDNIYIEYILKTPGTGYDRNW